MEFGQLQPGAHVRGLDTGGIAEIIQVRSFGPDALNLLFRVNGKIGERLLYRGDEIPFELVQPGRAYAFDADGGFDAEDVSVVRDNATQLKLKFKSTGFE
ncbi:hypothetical protein AD933_00955 [Acetobacter malorum]|uniref:Uncharacterized protein n=1 Tax=Acetobacter malorum TaxID=178901 RepID=A0A149S3F2_9PROT|nr:hypothetical protein [Acetobacter malorum]KXV21267.1 hypothetical protein AD933_00955 [Acetobacter malorum]